MSTSTQQIREWWSPPCTGALAKVSLFGGAVVSVRPAIVPAVRALSAVFEQWQYACTAPDCGAYNCRKITGGTRPSLHSYAIAIDINWQDNPYGPVLKTDMPKGMIDDVIAIRTTSGQQVWRWGGTYSGNKDAMHFEIVCSPADLATGIEGGENPPARILKPDDRGEDVKVLQKSLNTVAKFRINRVGKSPGAVIRVDGVYGDETTEAVREIQRFGDAMSRLAHGPGMTVDGIAGRQTIATIAFWTPKALEA
jgi:hypothetical protein